MARKAIPRKKSLATEKMADRLHSAAIHLLRRLRRVDEASGLSGPKLSALSVIVHRGPITLGDLATAEQVRPPTMTRLVGDLERAGLVQRQVDAVDRRIARVKASAAGRRLLTQGRNRRVELLAEWLDALDSHEKEILGQAVATLERIARPH
jgi:DNA-binding MarR family transcriptional regulator